VADTAPLVTSTPTRRCGGIVAMAATPRCGPWCLSAGRWTRRDLTPRERCGCAECLRKATLRCALGRSPDWLKMKDSPQGCGVLRRLHPAKHRGGFVPGWAAVSDRLVSRCA
jgi:hypothetical protein